MSIKTVGKIILLKIDSQKSKRTIEIRIINGECVEFDRVSRLVEYIYSCDLAVNYSYMKVDIALGFALPLNELNIP